MNNDSAGRTLSVHRDSGLSLFSSFLLALCSSFALIFTFHRRCRDIVGDFCYGGSDSDDSFMKSTLCAITGRLFSSPANKRKYREPRISANKEIVDPKLFHFFRATCPPHFIAPHARLNPHAVVGPSIFPRATGGCRKTRKRIRKRFGKVAEKDTLRLR